MLIALLPLGGATWLVGEMAAKSEVEKADATLNGGLRTAIGEFGTVLSAARTHARELAANPLVQRALADRNRSKLARLARENANVHFVLRGDTFRLAGVATATSSVAVTHDGRALGRVVVSVPLDDRLLARVGRAASLPAGDVLAIARSGNVIAGLPSGHLALEPNRAGDVRINDVRYRAVAARLPGGPDAGQLVALRSRAQIDAAVAAVRRDILLAALATLITIVLIGRLVAPAVGRGRLSRQQRAQAVRVLSHVGDGVFLVDHEGTIRFWNQAAERITGVHAREAIGRSPDELLHGWADSEHAVPLAAAPGASTPAGRPAPIQVRAGTGELWLSMSGVRFSEGTVYAFRDVTDERRVERLKSDFLSTVSHQVRTPLTSIYGASLMLKQSARELRPDTREKLFTVLSEQTDRLAHLFDDVLLASRLDSGDVDLARERFDAAELARGVVSEAQSQHGSVELSESPDAVAAAGDPARVRMVLKKLIENAIKYSPESAPVEVAVKAPDGRVRFEVRDQGLGLSLGEQEQLFSKFYRADPEMSRGVAGSGLGLYICRELVRRMGGEMWAQSQPGRGSVFAFELAAAGAPPGGQGSPS